MSLLASGPNCQLISLSFIRAPGVSLTFVMPSSNFMQCVDLSSCES